MINPHTGVAAWRQLAAALRARITSGEWPPGSLLPSQPRLRHDYDVGKATLGRAMDALRAEGLVDVEPGIGIRVREQLPQVRVAVPRGATVTSRMPDAEERAEMDIPEGVPILIVTIGGRVRSFAADRTTLTVA